MLSKPRETDELLRQYLLGELPEEEAERLDAMSVADDETAARLRAVENDLVDAYARGELPHERREQFRSAYMASPRRREKVLVAEGLRSLAEKREPTKLQPMPWFAALVPRLAFIAVLFVLAGAAAYLLTRPSRSYQPAVPPPHVAAQKQAPAKASPATRTAPTPAEALPAVSFVLMPPTRGTLALPTLSIPPDAGRVTLRLLLDADDFPRYRAVLRDLATDQIVWRSEELKPAADSDRPAVVIELPRTLLGPQSWSVELSGLPRTGEPELIAGYTFRVLLH